MLKRLIRTLDDSVHCRTLSEKLKYVVLRSLIPRLYKSYRTTDKHGHMYDMMNVASVIERHIILTGVWEPHTTGWIEDSLSAGEVVWDIGAHIGYDSLLAGKLVGETGKVIAFEPHPVIAAQLRNNIALNGYKQIEVIEACVVSEPDLKEVTLYFPDAKTLHSGMSSLVTPNSSEGNDRSANDVRCLGVYLPEMLSEGKIPKPHLIKIDVEGFEAAVIRSLKEFFSNLDGPLSVIVEVRAKVDAKPEPIALLEQFGNFKVIDRTTGQPKPESSVEYDVLMRNH